MRDLHLLGMLALVVVGAPAVLIVMAWTLHFVFQPVLSFWDALMEERRLGSSWGQICYRPEYRPWPIPVVANTWLLWSYYWIFQREHSMQAWPFGRAEQREFSALAYESLQGARIKVERVYPNDREAYRPAIHEALVVEYLGICLVFMVVAPLLIAGFKVISVPFAVLAVLAILVNAFLCGFWKKGVANGV